MSLRRGRANRCITRVATLIFFTLGTMTQPARAAVDGEHPDVVMALVRYSGGNWNPRPHGLPKLAWEVRKRTSIAIDLDVMGADPATQAIFDYPLLFWQGDAAFDPLPQNAIANLKAHLQQGGNLLVDVSDAMYDGPFAKSVRRELTRIFDKPLIRVPDAHVLYKSFYLLDRHGGRVPTRAFLEGQFVENRLAVIVSYNDLAGAIARNAFGEWEYDTGAGGTTAREMTFRLGVNWLMYALCLDYKEDQVHIPFILQRRR